MHRKGLTMTKHLIIAEKPDMGRNIADAFITKENPKVIPGKGFVSIGDITVTWCFGHLMRSFHPQEYNKDWELWKLDTLPMIMEQWRVKVNTTSADGKTKELSKLNQFNIIKKLISESDIIYNAGDPGREGQLIVDEILFDLNIPQNKTKRLNLQSLTRTAVLKEFANAKNNSDYYNVYQAGLARGIADWLTGLNATRLYSINAQKAGYRGVLSVGRVQSPMLSIVVNRDEEIENFIPHDYYTLLAEFKSKAGVFNLGWRPNANTPENVLDKEKRIIDMNFYKSLVNKVKGQQGTVFDMVNTSGKEKAPLPFNLSKLQIYANKKWGMSAKEVLDTCQNLYEKHKVQTYPRTDCQYLPPDQFDLAPQILNNVSGYFPQLATAIKSANTNLKSQAWDESKLSDHFGLIPTGKTASTEAFTKNEALIHQAVCERYIAQFYPDCEFNTSTVTVTCANEIFKASGKMITNPGWKSVFSDMEDDKVDTGKNNESDELTNSSFPPLSKGEGVLNTGLKTASKKTKPPARHTEGTLLAAVTNIHTLVDDPKQKAILKDKKGIGQEATRASIIEGFFYKKLLVKQGKSIISTSGARTLIHALPKILIDPALTALWEDELDKIAQGKLSLGQFKKMQENFITKIINDNKEKPINIIKAPQSVTKEKACPKCSNGSLIKRVAKASGKTFLGCSLFPKCDYVEWPKK